MSTTTTGTWTHLRPSPRRCGTDSAQFEAIIRRLPRDVVGGRGLPLRLRLFASLALHHNGLNVQQTADLFGVHPTTLRRWVADIDHLLASGACDEPDGVRIPDIRALLDSCERSRLPAPPVAAAEVQGGAVTGERAAPVARWRHRARRVADVSLIATIVVVVLLGYGVIGNRWYRVIGVTGASMEPTYSRGDALVLTRPPALEDIEVGMVLTLQVEDRLVTHRVIEVGSDGSFVTQGDANEIADDWTGVRVRVAGIPRADIPVLGRLLQGVPSFLGGGGGGAGSGAWFTARVEGGEVVLTTAPPEPSPG